MLSKSISLSIASALIFCLPQIAAASDIEVRAGNVKVSTSRDGDIYINSGRRGRYRSLPRRYGRYNDDFYYDDDDCCRSGYSYQRQYKRSNRYGSSVTQIHYDCR
ncbi:MAG: hypothetical protein D6756_01965 [Cyanobacteria bacterium J083]|nr:MAG: hypothetical protein D6756_01965 [Cyanobacteria bacterium J083]